MGDEGGGSRISKNGWSHLCTAPDFSDKLLYIRVDNFMDTHEMENVHNDFSRQKNAEVFLYVFYFKMYFLG